MIFPKDLPLLLSSKSTHGGAVVTLLPSLLCWASLWLGRLNRFIIYNIDVVFKYMPSSKWVYWTKLKSIHVFFSDRYTYDRFFSVKS